MLKNSLYLSTQRALISVLCLFGFGNSLLYAQSAVEVAKLLASDGASDDRFGYSVDVDGDTAVVGAFFHDHQGMDSGAGYVFVRNGDTWTEQAELLPSDGMAGDQAGLNQIAVDGDTILLGALLHDDGVTDAGVVYVFERNGNTWTETTKLHADDRQPGDQFGITVDMDGDTAIVGANGDVHPDGTQGSVYVFVRNGDTWTQQAKLLGSEIDVPFPGYAASGISIDGETVAVPAPTTDPQGRDSGAAYIFVRNGITWTQQARLILDDGLPQDQFGNYTALDHDTLIVGRCRCHARRGEGGAAYVYTRNGSTWTQQAKLTPVDGVTGDTFGGSLGIDGDRAVIGAMAASELGQNAGAAYVFVRNGNTWTEQEKLLASDGESQDHFGVTVAMDGSTVLIGAWEANLDDPEGRDTGSAYLFKLPSEFEINAGLNGNWWNGLDRNGEGVQVEVSDGDEGSLTLVATIYSYDDMGNQIFLIAVGTVSGDTADVDVFITEGGQWGDAYDPALVNESQWGTGTFTASSCDAMQMVLMPNADFQDIGYTDLMYDLIRLTTPAAPCPIENPN